MRDVQEEQSAWKPFPPKSSRPALSSFAVGAEEYDFSSACLIFGGRNGAGKSRLLRSLADTLGDKGLLLDLHHLSEQAMILLRSRKDLNEMVEEAGLYEPHERRVEDLGRIIGRGYTSIEWSQLELIPFEAAVEETFKWGSDQATVPFFRVKHGERSYSSLDMGLGEFAMHMLMWILEQYQDEGELTLLLDEPDAFLPPVGVVRLLRRLMLICRERGWQLILTTHSEEMIRTAVSHDAFVLLHIDAAGVTKALTSRDNRSVAVPLLARLPIELVLFCEDEAAFYLISSMIRSSDVLDPQSVSISWGRGNGYMEALRKALPKPERSPISFIFVFDGDQWNRVKPATGSWPSRFLPSGADPDAMFREAMDVGVFASRVGEEPSIIDAFLSSVDGDDNHDWVNKLADRFGRVPGLAALADMWVAKNQDHASEFVRSLALKDELLLHSTQVSLKEAEEAEVARARFAAEAAHEE